MDAGVQVLIMFSYGFIMPIFELHMISFGLNETESSAAYASLMASYIIGCVLISKISESFNKIILHLIGLILCFISLLMMAPCEYIFPNNFVIVVFGLITFGFSSAFVYGN